jgi:hypothetical protein
VTAARDAGRVSSTSPAASSALVIIRAWTEPDAGLRLRITLARPLEALPEETVTVAEVDAGLALVRGFLTQVAETARPGAG